jgi:hypothetical protein
MSLAAVPLGAQPSAPAPVQAVQANINITPKRLNLNEKKRTDSAFIFNQGNVPVTVDVSVVDRVMLPDGQIKTLADAQAQPDLKPVTDRLRSARPFTMVTPRRVTLMPGKGQTIRLRAALPADADAREYRSHLTVITVPPRDVGLTAENAAAQKAGELAIRINAVFGLSIPVIVRNGASDARAALADLKLEEELLSPDGVAPPAPVPILSFDIARLGSSSLYGNVQVRSESDRKDVVASLRGIGVYPEIDNRRVRVRLLRKPVKGETLDVQFIDDDVVPGRVLARQSFTVR